jgi:hypothetical protein
MGAKVTIGPLPVNTFFREIQTRYEAGEKAEDIFARLRNAACIMLAILSDLHLCDATASDNVNPDAFEKILLTALIGNAVPRGAKEIRLVLLGDIYDLVRTSQWFTDGRTGKSVPPNERPWNGKIDPATGMNRNVKKVEGRFRRILKDTLEATPHFARMVSKAALATELPTTVHYVIGNHDRALHNFPSLQKMIQDAFAPVPVEFTRCVHWPEYGTTRATATSGTRTASPRCCSAKFFSATSGGTRSIRRSARASTASWPSAKSSRRS